MLILMLTAATASPSVEEAAALIKHRGCLSCHTLDGTASVGPTLAGLAGSERELVGGEVVIANADYIRESIAQPNRRIVDGFKRDLMPAVTRDVEELVAAVEALPPEAAPRFGWLWLPLLSCSSIAFVGLHLLLTADAIHARAVGRLGATAYQGIASLPITLALGGMVLGWSQAPHVALWAPLPWTRWIPLLLMPISFVLVVAGYSTKSPTQAGQEDALSTGPVGIQTITRHPANWGIALWSACHLFPNGDLAAVLFFGAFAVLAVVGSLHIDARRARAHGARWDAFSSKTSFMPFLAAAKRGMPIDFAGIGVWRVAVGLALYTLILLVHEWVIGVSPLPLP